MVDRVGFNDASWLDQESHPHSDKLHVIERYKRPDLGIWKPRSRWKIPACWRSHIR